MTFIKVSRAGTNIKTTSNQHQNNISQTSTQHQNNIKPTQTDNDNKDNNEKNVNNEKKKVTAFDFSKITDSVS